MRYSSRVPLRENSTNNNKATTNNNNNKQQTTAANNNKKQRHHHHHHRKQTTINDTSCDKFSRVQLRSQRLVVRAVEGKLNKQQRQNICNHTTKTTFSKVSSTTTNKQRSTTTHRVMRSAVCSSGPSGSSCVALRKSDTTSRRIGS